MCTQEQQEETLEPGNSASAFDSDTSNEKAEVVPPPYDQRHVSESPSNGAEGDRASLGHPLNGGCSSGEMAENVPPVCSEVVSLEQEPEPEPEPLIEHSGPVRNAPFPRKHFWVLIVHLLYCVVKGVSN